MTQPTGEYVVAIRGICGMEHTWNTETEDIDDDVVPDQSTAVSMIIRCPTCQEVAVRVQVVMDNGKSQWFGR